MTYDIWAFMWSMLAEDVPDWFAECWREWTWLGRIVFFPPLILVLVWLVVFGWAVLFFVAIVRDAVAILVDTDAVWDAVWRVLKWLRPLLFRTTERPRGYAPGETRTEYIERTLGHDPE